MGNSLFGSCAVPSRIQAELTEHPVVRYRPNNVQAPTEERCHEIPEQFGDSNRRSGIQCGAEPPYNDNTKGITGRERGGCGI